MREGKIKKIERRKERGKLRKWINQKEKEKKTEKIKGIKRKWKKKENKIKWELKIRITEFETRQKQCWRHKIKTKNYKEET